MGILTAPNWVGRFLHKSWAINRYVHDPMGTFVGAYGHTPQRENGMVIQQSFIKNGAER
jgi:hypothetical protein